jgi:hypothetical protein
MSKRPSIWPVLAFQLVFFSRLCMAGASQDSATLLNRPPVLKPDYAGITIPPNIAPLNFIIQEPASDYLIRISGAKGKPIELKSKSGRVLLPSTAWHELLSANKGSDLSVDIRVQTNGQWMRFPAITNHVAAEEIDPFLIYRKIHPAHSSWALMGLFQRDLRNFDETQFLDNKRFSEGCCHCHMLSNNDPDQMMVLIRSVRYANSALVINNGISGAIDGQIGFVSWHPKTLMVAAAFSKPRLVLHSALNDMRDIVELEGWIGYFDLKSKTVKEVPGLRDKKRLLAFPAWAPDGRHLYYCSAPNPDPLTNEGGKAGTPDDEKYDLMRVSYNLEKDQWGAPEPVLLACDTGFSMAQPRISQDGHWLFVCGIPHGCWPAYDHTSDIYGLDLREGEATGKFTFRKLSLNSDECESWLSWSANSRWVVFSSKRLSPLINRPHISYVGPDATCSKPFVLPQRDPEFYDSLLCTYTIPTLAIKPVTVPQRELIDAIKSANKPKLIMPTTQSGAVPAATPPVR